jgi:hypothetical protein
MTTILAVIAVLVAAGFTIRWCIRTMLGHACPACYRTSGDHELVIPFIPGVRSWCPTCNGTFRPSALVVIDEEPDSAQPAEPAPPQF